jgi:hypothetical protein
MSGDSLTTGWCWCWELDIDTLNRAMDVYRDKKRWVRHTILSVAGSGYFSSDRTIREYARDIWKVEVSMVHMRVGTKQVSGTVMIDWCLCVWRLSYDRLSVVQAQRLYTCRTLHRN